MNDQDNLINLLRAENERLKQRAEKAEAACAEMLDVFRCVYYETNECRIEDLVSDIVFRTSDCGKDWVPSSQVEKLRESFKFCELQISNARAIAYHVRIGEAFGGCTRDALADWLESLANKLEVAKQALWESK